MNSGRIELIVYDFDGVMTNNSVIVFENGMEAVIVNRADGLGVNMIRDLGILQIILSTETNDVVAARAKKLNLKVIYGCKDKKAKLSEYCENKNIDLNKVLYVGNDINDLEAMKAVGFSVAPADAHKEILKFAGFITNAKGGQGVIKELSEFIINKGFKLKLLKKRK